jgi:hypothetical protein
LPRLEWIGGDWLIQNAVIRKITDRAAGGAAGRDRELTAGFHERLIRAPVRAHDHSATVHNHVGNVGAPGLDLVDRVSFADVTLMAGSSCCGFCCMRPGGACFRSLPHAVPSVFDRSRSRIGGWDESNGTGWAMAWPEAKSRLDRSEIDPQRLARSATLNIEAPRAPTSIAS